MKGLRQTSHGCPPPSTPSLLLWTRCVVWWSAVPCAFLWFSFHILYSKQVKDLSLSTFQRTNFKSVWVSLCHLMIYCQAALLRWCLAWYNHPNMRFGPSLPAATKILDNSQRRVLFGELCPKELHKLPKMKNLVKPENIICTVFQILSHCLLEM